MKAIVRVFLVTLVFTVALCHPAKAQLVIYGGTTAQRVEIAHTISTALHGLVLPGRKVTVSILSPARMSALLNSGPSVNSSDDKQSNGGAGDNSGEGVVDGVYDASPSVISLLDDNPPMYMDMTFVHEYGHHIWCYFATRSDQKAYQLVYDRERSANQMISDYAATCKEEGFAEDFSYFLLDPSDLARVAPGSYAYMQQLTHRLRAYCSVADADESERTAN